MILTDDTDYYKMCVAAGLNYYRKVPDVEDLLNFSGWDTKTIISIYTLYIQNQKICPFRMDKRIVLNMIMNENYGLDWNGSEWFNRRDHELSLFNYWGYYH